MKPKIFVCLLVAVAGSTAQPQAWPPRITGFFSDMRPDPAGDVAGTEIWIVYGGKQFWASMQEAEGEPNPPVTVPLEVSNTSKVTFTVTTHPSSQQDDKPGPDLIRHYEGIISNSGLLLSRPDLPRSTPRLLKRGVSYWQ